MAKGDLSQVNAIKCMNEIEFYFLLDSFKEDIKEGRFNLPQSLF